MPASYHRKIEIKMYKEDLNLQEETLQIQKLTTIEEIKRLMVMVMVMLMVLLTEIILAIIQDGYDEIKDFLFNILNIY